jgi:hypothetical protein
MQVLLCLVLRCYIDHSVSHVIAGELWLWFSFMIMSSQRFNATWEGADVCDFYSGYTLDEQTQKRLEMSIFLLTMQKLVYSDDIFNENPISWASWRGKIGWEGPKWL